MLNRITLILAKAGLNIFFLLMLLAIFMAWLKPGVGVAESFLHLPMIAGYGVSLIFFFYGAKLSPESLISGLTNWRLHLLVQLSTFLFFPLIISVFKLFMPDYFLTLTGIGIYFLAALPSTVSSSVVMIAIARGNIAAGIFNASISSILGIFLTPLLMSGILEKATAGFDISHTIFQLCIQVLFPVIAGLLLHQKLGKWVILYKNGLRNFDQLIILLIVYTSFCESFSGRMFDQLSFLQIIFLGLLMLLLFLTFFIMMNQLSIRLGFNREDRITIIFCGSKKSLVQGAVMGKVLFPEQSMLGVVLLPLMIYHALQLLTGSIIANEMGKVKSIPEKG